MAEWRRNKGLDGADVRLLGDHRDAAGKKQLDLRQAVMLMKDPTDADFPIAGVKAAKEFHSSVAASSNRFPDLPRQIAPVIRGLQEGQCGACASSSV